MRESAWKALCAVVCAVLVVPFVLGFVGACDGVLECASGPVPMRCHWAFRVQVLLVPVVIVASLLALYARTREGRRIAVALSALLAVAAALMLTPLGIGVCPGAEMGCDISALVLWTACAVAVALDAVLFTKADPDAAAKPKRML